MRVNALLTSLFAILLAAPASAFAQDQATGSTHGGAAYSETAPAPPPPGKPVVEGYRAKRLPDGTAAAPSLAPPAVQQAIWAANEIVGKPYKNGGGHRRLKDSGYDCSGTISYALAGASLLRSPLDSSSFMRWGERGKGSWITVYTNPGHAYAVIAGLRLDTSSAGERRSSGKGPRWRTGKRKQRGYKRVHPPGY